MKNIIFIAPPSAGKGTQSDLLVKRYGYFHISTGDLLRKEMEAKSEIGKEIENIMNSGNLVSDDIVTKLLRNTLEKSDKPFILDGYPRNTVQGEILDELLHSLNKEIGIAIYLDIDEATATSRATGRMICSKCKRSYHKYDEVVKPKVDGKCDVCLTDLIIRSDDTEETFKVRYQNYIKNTAALLDFYKSKGLLVNINVKDTPEATFTEIEKVIK